VTIIPEFWPSTKKLSETELDQLILEVDNKAEEWADEIRVQSTQTKDQLILLHDLIARRIDYDLAAENHAGCALLKGVTLCQGYAQAYQMIGQKLGHSVEMNSGLGVAFDHTWNLVFLDGSAYHVDLTYDDIYQDEGIPGLVSHRYLFRSDIAMQDTHHWDKP